ncbi:MAG TPA: hypothetical protein VGM90_30035 [Kofleriaceae bacterium]|jgi:ElaB/YqjD/DUF883 family membrane-anchored ribosome-binding protein
MNKTTGNTTTENGSFDGIKDAVSHFVDDGKEKVAGLKDKAMDLKEKAIDLKDQALEKSTSLLDAATDAIKTNPLKAVGIAFGVGYVAMRIFRR